MKDEAHVSHGVTDLLNMLDSRSDRIDLREF
jgi:hypothetical protein